MPPKTEQELFDEGTHSRTGDKLVPFVTTVHEAVRTILRWVGQDPTSAGLVDTPDRVARAFTEMTAGYKMDPAKILSKTFEEQCDEIVILKGIAFHSTCEHHLLPFVGEAAIAYIPGKVVGLSKLARLVDCFAQRLQMQERMTRQIAMALQEHLEAKGVGVIVEASHSCMGCRGVKKPDARMITSVCLGLFREDPKARSELMSLLK